MPLSRFANKSIEFENSLLRSFFLTYPAEKSRPYAVCIARSVCVNWAICLNFLLLFNVGLLHAHYNSVYRKNHQLCLTILKRFGFGHRVMEKRILTEVEEMMSKVREEQGRPLDVRHLTASCVVNVLMNMLFGRRFHHSDPSFKQLISDAEYLVTGFSMIVDVFPLLRFLPFFKQFYAKAVSIVGNANSFINKNTAECIEVCKLF